MDSKILQMQDTLVQDSLNPITIDAIGLLCPLPVLRLHKRLQPLSEGTLVALLTTDPMALLDVKHFCNESGHTLINHSKLDDKTTKFIIKKGF